MQKRLWICLVSCCWSLGLLPAQKVLAQNAPLQTGQPAATPGFFTDPKTGITYRQEVRTIQRPVVDEKIETREQVTYQPEYVTSVQNESRTVYTPTVRYGWQPKWHGWWNPFKQPTLAYHYTPQTAWEARVENVQHPSVSTRWVEKKQVVQVPTRTTRWEVAQEVVQVPVTIPQDRFQPLPPNQVMPGYNPPLSPSQIASDRDRFQSGMRATVLGDSSNPAIIAGAPRATVWR